MGVGRKRGDTQYLAAAEKESGLPPARDPQNAHCCNCLFLALLPPAEDRSTCVHFPAQVGWQAVLRHLLLFSAAAFRFYCRQPSTATGSA